MDYRQTLAPGTTLLDQYRIVRVLGVGGFGITYMARDSGLDVDVAIKEYFPAEFGMRDPSMTVRPATSSQAPVFEQCRASFVREARTLAQFRHPSIVRVLRVFEANGTAYTVMEYIAGQSLASWAEALNRRPRQSELDGILKPLISALDDLHAASFIHRDIAPDNILIRKDGSPVLIDFGATRQVLASTSRNFTGVVKQGYSPPEQYAMDAKLQGPWTDVYALGGILYWLVTGEKPVPAPERQLGIAQRPATEATGGYRRTFLEGIDWALRLAPADRPQSLAELSRSLLPPDRPVREDTTVIPHARTEQIPVERWTPPGAQAWTKSMRTAVPVAGAALIGLALIWQAGGFDAGSPPSPVVAEQQRVADRQRVAIAETQRLDAERRVAAEKQAAEERRRAEADRQRIESEKRAAAEKLAAEERRQAAERADTERQRAEAERLRIELDKRATAEKQAAEERRRAAESAEVERQRVETEKRTAAEKQAADERRRAETERQRIEAGKRAAAEQQEAEKRRLAAERAEAERQRIEVEKRTLADAQAEEQRRRAAEKDAERQRAAAEQLAVEAQRILVADIRFELNRLGCTTRATTPGWTDDDQRALERFVRDSGGTVSFPRLDLEIVRVLQGARQRTCQPCPAGETEVNGRCVADTARTQTPPVSAAVQCNQINERAQLGLLTEEDRTALRRLNCR